MNICELMLSQHREEKYVSGWIDIELRILWHLNSTNSVLCFRNEINKNYVEVEFYIFSVQIFFFSAAGNIIKRIFKMS